MKTADMYISCCGNKVLVGEDAAALPAVRNQSPAQKHFISTKAEKRVIGDPIKGTN